MEKYIIGEKMNHEKENVWIITNPSGEFWNNEFGWVDKKQATLFTNKRKQNANLPINGKWVQPEYKY